MACVRGFGPRRVERIARIVQQQIVRRDQCYGIGQPAGLENAGNGQAMEIVVFAPRVKRTDIARELQIRAF